MATDCSYCLEEITGDSLHCLDCCKDVHVSCLKKLPEDGILLGDIFYDFKCVQCQSREEIARRKLRW